MASEGLPLLWLYTFHSTTPKSTELREALKTPPLPELYPSSPTSPDSNTKRQTIPSVWCLSFCLRAKAECNFNRKKKERFKSHSGTWGPSGAVPRNPP
jgi:hypothetical protein